MAPINQNEPWLTSALHVVKQLVTDINVQGIKNENIWFAGFSQGACLTLEYITRNAARYGGVAAFTGGLTQGVEVLTRRAKTLRMSENVATASLGSVGGTRDASSG